MTILPPLNALRAFEVAARTGSFVQAAVELGVTSAAVSQQVKQLETHLARRLFQRQGNRIVLTDAGRALYPRLEVAFADLTAATADLRDAQARPRLVISVLPVLAEAWLIPALAGFGGDMGIEIRVEDDPVVLARDGVDLRLTFGAHLYPDHRVETLFADVVIAVSAPGFVDRAVIASASAAPGAGQSGAGQSGPAQSGPGLSGLPDRAFIHTDWGPAYGSQPGWAAWLDGRAPDPAQGVRVGLSGLALAAARAGIGVALVPERIAASDLAAGTLIRVDPRRMALRWDFVMIYSHAMHHRRPLQAFLAHLRLKTGGLETG